MQTYIHTYILYIYAYTYIHIAKANVKLVFLIALC